MMDQHKADAEDKGRRKRKINSAHNFMQVCSTVTSFVILTSAIRLLFSSLPSLPGATYLRKRGRPSKWTGFKILIEPSSYLEKTLQTVLKPI